MDEDEMGYGTFCTDELAYKETDGDAYEVFVERMKREIKRIHSRLKQLEMDC